MIQDNTHGAEEHGNATGYIGEQMTDNVAPPVWDDGRDRPDPHKNIKDLVSTVSITKDLRQDCPTPILVCSDCRDYYEFDEDWQVCPKCGDGLTEVDKA